MKYPAVLKLCIIPIALILLTTAGLAAAQDGRYPAHAELYVNDYADVIRPAEEAAIRGRLVELGQTQGIQMTVLTVRSFQDYGTNDATFESFATNLFNEWGIGDAERNDGVLILVAVLDRKVRIELGTGYGREYNGRMQTIIDEIMLPHFRREAYGRGIDEGSQAVITALTGVESETARWQQTATSWPALALYSVVALVGGTAVKRRYRRWVGYKCPQCAGRMAWCNDTAATALLDAGQQREKALASVRYDAWQCPHCLHHRVNPHNSLKSRYRHCPRCRYRTVETELTVLQVATADSEGRKRTRQRCHHCYYQQDEIGIIPRRQTAAVVAQDSGWNSDTSSDYGSSDSAGSFDGGSSDGGGASGDW